MTASVLTRVPEASRKGYRSAWGCIDFRRESAVGSVRPPPCIEAGLSSLGQCHLWIDAKGGALLFAVEAVLHPPVA